MANAETITAQDIERYRANYIVEKDGIALYRAMAAAEKDDKRAEIFEKLAQNEERHAQRWARLIESAGGNVPAHRPSARVSLLGWLARRFGTKRVIPIISSLEARDEAGYRQQPEAEGLPAEERRTAGRCGPCRAAAAGSKRSPAPSAGI